MSDTTTSTRDRKAGVVKGRTGKLIKLKPLAGKVIKARIVAEIHTHVPTPPAPKPTPGERMLGGMREVLDTLKAGGMKAVEKKFTVRRVKLPAIKPAAVSPEQVAKLRGDLGVSQGVLAAWLGVSPSTVQGWEQGVNPPAGAAARMLAEMTRDPAHWRKRLADDLAGASG